MAKIPRDPAKNSDVEPDWESAFQVEDFLLDPDNDGAGSLFSLEDEAPSGAHKGASTQAGVLPADGRRQQAAPMADGVLARLGLWSALLPATLRRKADGLTPQSRGIVLCCLVGFLIVLVGSVVTRLFFLPPQVGNEGRSVPVVGEVVEPAPPRLLIEPAPVAEVVVEEQSEAVTQTETSTPPVDVALSNALTGQAVVTPESVIVTDEVADDSQYPEFERRKWRFSSFMISPHTQEEGQPVSYVVVDLSLVLHLPAGDSLPEDRLYFIRDTIYQFYQNRPLYELRRYALARGEMKQKLMVWLRKQWPEGPVDTIFFHRYKII